MIRRIIIAAAVLALAACTPEQIATYEQTTGIDINDHDTETMLALPDAPMALDHTHLITTDGSIITVTTGPCSQWHDLAISAGITPGQWATIARLMYRESRCQPGAYNRSGASGLMQIMPMWADDCGIGRAQLLEAWYNLRCAVHVLAVQGWGAWSL